MFLDFNSLLIALSFCSIGLVVTFFVSWLVSRKDHVLMTWCIGVLCLVVAIFIYRRFIDRYSPIEGVAAFSALLVGLTLFKGAARQFATGALPFKLMTIIATTSITLVTIPLLTDRDGVSYIMLNLASAVIMMWTGIDYWPWREKSPLLIWLLMILYALTSISFVMCAGTLIVDRSWVMHHAPSGIIEDLNLVMCLIAIGSMGALSLGLNQVRQTLHHKRDAETDMLTGLSNRRALFDQSRNLQPNTAVIIFDIDHFKRINDVHGHQVGDTVLQTFGSLLTTSIRDTDIAARLGGEEFALILANTSLREAERTAEGIRLDFAKQRFISPASNFSSTVSGGIAFAERKANFASLLRYADLALYEAKHGGRDRVTVYVERTSLVPTNDDWSGPVQVGGNARIRHRS